MNNIIPVEITVWQIIIDQYSSALGSRKLSLSDLYNLEYKLKDDLERISSKKDVYHEVVGGNLAYVKPNAEISTRVGYHDINWKGHPTWALNIPILNYENIVLNFYKGNYTGTRVTNEVSTFMVPEWVGTPELEESTLLNRPVLMNMEAPFSFNNQSDNPAIFLNLRFVPSLLA